MTWDPIWESVFRSQAWGKYPSEDLVRFIARRFYGASDRQKVRILEVGCGAGANLWFMAREGFAAHGIDGSKAAIEAAAARLAEDGLSASLTVGDISDLERIYPPAAFDAVVDIGCLTCNRLSDVASALRGIRAVMKPGGAVYSSLVATGTVGEGTGTCVEEGTYRDIREGPLAGRGLIHMFTEAEVRDIFGPFDQLSVDIHSRGPVHGASAYRLYVVQGTRPADACTGGNEPEEA